MTPELKEKWVTALRSGDYQQGRLFLNNNGYCCLGVLCDVSGEGSWLGGRYFIDGFTRTGNHQLEDLRTKFGVTNEQERFLADMNDGSGSRAPRPFDQIADWIEANL